MKRDKIKVCILVFSLGSGGAEKSSAILSQMLSESGYEVTIVSVLDDIIYDYKGKLINLEKETASATGFYKRCKKYLLLSKLIKKEKFDYIIDTRSRASFFKQFLINTLLYKNIRVVFVVHNFNLKNYFPNNVFLGHFLYKNAYEIVGVSKGCVKHFRQKFKLAKGRCIYNALDDTINDKATAEIKLPEPLYIISYGRILDSHKNYIFLIKSFALSDLPKKGIKLYIIGDGPDKDKLQLLSKNLGLENKVEFIGFTNNPFPYVKKALLTTLTSNYEGFPMVLLESMALQTPVVAIDCKSGPSEIIVTGKNGILVPFKDQHGFVQALNTMVEDTNFYQKCKEGTVSSVQKFKKENIIAAWKEILKPIHN